MCSYHFDWDIVSSHAFWALRTHGVRAKDSAAQPDAANVPTIFYCSTNLFVFCWNRWQPKSVHFGKEGTIKKPPLCPFRLFLCRAWGFFNSNDSVHFEKVRRPLMDPPPERRHFSLAPHVSLSPEFQLFAFRFFRFCSCVSWCFPPKLKSVSITQQPNRIALLHWESCVPFSFVCLYLPSREIAFV